MPWSCEHYYVGEVPIRTIRIARATAIDVPLRHAIVVHRLRCNGELRAWICAGRAIGNRSAHWRANLDGPAERGIGRIDREALLYDLYLFRTLDVGGRAARIVGHPSLIDPLVGFGAKGASNQKQSNHQQDPRAHDGGTGTTGCQPSGH